jgi:hypothetical protein
MPRRCRYQGQIVDEVAWAAKCPEGWQPKYANPEPHEFRRECEQICNELDVAVHSMIESLNCFGEILLESRQPAPVR